MRDGVVFITLLIATVCISRIESVSFINKCKSDDSKCIKESAQAALPVFAAGLQEYGTEKLDPVTIHKIDASTPGLKFVLTDIVVKGLKDCVIKKIKRDKGKSKLFFKIMCNVEMDGTYEMKGQLLILPIEGNGPVHTKLRKLEVSVEIDLNQGDNWDILSYKHSFELKDKADVVFENLFNGNEALAAAARDVIANSGNEIVLEIGPPVVKSITDLVLKQINKFFHAVPAQELSLD
ncbi:protein takeout-like [Battus philenor]|uniref:protein takeout-like n=1 Tax=Battus philenor TaxID=42288 RepID=UPI0035D01719